MHFSIVASYEWKKKGEKVTPHSELAIKELVKSVDQYFSKRKLKSGDPFKIVYKRLRASAGELILNKIFKRIDSSNSIIVDISDSNLNVFIELGLAIALSFKNGGEPNIYLIREKKSNDFTEPPSDLKGFFISEYVIKSNRVVFNDQGSLRMSLISDIKNFYSDLEHRKNSIS